MSMSKKDYESVAASISEARKRLLGGKYLYGTDEYNAAHYAIYLLEDFLCRDFKESNPNFDTEKFLKACVKY